MRRAARDFAEKRIRLEGPPSISVWEDEAGRGWDDPADLEWGAAETRWCLEQTRVGGICRNRAGAGTIHAGVGLCWLHEGRVDGGRAQGRRIGAWIMAHGFARALDCSPWEGLLTAVRIAAGRVAWIELKLGTAWSDRQLEPPHEDSGEVGRAGEGGQNLNYWVKQAEIWHDKLVRVSKLAIDAGVAERLVRQLELEAQLMLRATHRMADDLGLDEDTRQRAISSIAGHLTRLEIEEKSERDEDAEPQL